jgi:hypothetical protein
MMALFKSSPGRGGGPAIGWWRGLGGGLGAPSTALRAVMSRFGCPPDIRSHAGGMAGLLIPVPGRNLR